MCGRYQFTAEQCAEILQIVQEVERRHGAGAWTPGEIRPTAIAPDLISSSDGIHPELQSWGYKLPGNLIINARAETAADKPLFRASGAGGYACYTDCPVLREINTEMSDLILEFFKRSPTLSLKRRSSYAVMK